MEKKVIMTRDKVKDNHTQEVFSTMRQLSYHNPNIACSNMSSLIQNEKQMIMDSNYRKKFKNMIGILDRVKKIITLSNSDYCTVEAVADFFETDIENILKDSIDYEPQLRELINLGLDYISPREAYNEYGLKNCYVYHDKNNLFKSNNYHRDYVLLFNRRCILNIAMCFYNCPVATRVRLSLINMSENPYAIQEEVDSLNSVISELYHKLNKISKSQKEEMNLFKRVNEQQKIIKVLTLLNEYKGCDPEALLGEGAISEDEYDAFCEYYSK